MAVRSERRVDPELTELFAEVMPRERRRAIVELLVGRAVDGDVRVAMYLFDRLYGRPNIAPAPMGFEEALTTPLDMGALDDMEAANLVDLLERCGFHEPSGERAGGGEEGGRAAAVSEGTGCLREGGAEGRLVDEAGGGR